jgi:hypothetical protein
MTDRAIRLQQLHRLYRRFREPSPVIRNFFDHIRVSEECNKSRFRKQRERREGVPAAILVS